MISDEKYRPVRPRRSTRLLVRGVEYELNEWGPAEGRALVYLHGWGDTGSTFQFVVDALPEDWRIVAPDWRGFGRSTCRAESYWFPDYVADLDCLLDAISPKDPACLIGHSMGANVAGLYCGIRPERVGILVNVEGFGLADRDPAGAPDNYRRWLDQAKSLRPFSEYPGLPALADRVMKNNPRMRRDRAVFVAAEWADLGADGIARLRADPAHKLPNPILYRRAEAEACWQRAAADVLLVIGAETDFKTGAKAWIDPDESRQPFHGAPMVVIPAAGHMVHFDAPEALAQAIADFVTPRL